MRALVSTLFVCLALVACKKPDEGKAELTAAKEEAPIRVETAKVEQRPMPEYLVITGTLRANQESEVAADAAGKVTRTFVERGQTVTVGDPLVVLDSRGASISAHAASAQSQLAHAQLEQARKECERVKALKETGAISQAEYDRVTSQCQTTQFSAAAAQAQSQSAQKIVGDAVIRAPFTGIVGERYVNVGQYVQPSTRVVSLYEPDPVRLELTLPEANAGAVKPDMPVLFQVATYGDTVFQGAVKFIAPNIRPTTRDLVIEAVCPNTDGRLKPGMFAVAKLQVGESPAPVVPVTAVVRDAEKARVYAVVAGHAHERVVQLGGDREGLVAVLVGVKPGEVVVIKPVPGLRDGVAVH
jgi:membrane fusion protein (multidrug efflux system)